MFTPITPIQLDLLPGTDQARTERQAVDTPFADIFQSAIQNVRDTEAAKVEVQTLMATGQLDNPADLTIAQTKAATAVELLTQLRTRTMDAYNEISRISF